ncbi:MAG: hypothetical protein CHACPFDD_03338 [Phycisphaerae bacterium]|nr:hypothetical protein [Phycisphaerae bacterium]
MSRSDTLKLLLACGALLVSAAFVFWSRRGAAPPGAFFYDLSEKRLYAAPRDAFAPVEGVGGETGDGVEAIVVRCEQCPAELRRVAYLQTHSTEFKQRHDAAKAAGGAPIAELTRAYIAANTLVRTVDGSEWFATSTPEGSRIVRDWKRRCPQHGAWEKPLRP